MRNDGEPKCLGAFSGQPVLEEVGKHTHAERNEQVGDESNEGDTQFAFKSLLQFLGLRVSLVELYLDWRTGEMRLLVSQLLGPICLNETPNDPRLFVLGKFPRILVIGIVLNDFSFLRDACGYFARIFETAQGIDDEKECHDSHDHENDCLEGVRISGSAGTSHEHVSEHNAAHHEPRQPRRDASRPRWLRRVVEQVGECSGGDRLDDLASSDDANEQVRHDQENQDWEKNITYAVRFETSAKELDLRDVTMFLPKDPQAYTNDEENSGMHEAADGGHQAVGADAAFKGFSRGTDEGESRHGRTKYAHQKEKRPDTVTGYEIILAGAPEQAATEKAEPDEQAEIQYDDNQLGHASGSFSSLLEELSSAKASR